MFFGASTIKQSTYKLQFSSSHTRLLAGGAVRNNLLWQARVVSAWYIHQLLLCGTVS